MGREFRIFHSDVIINPSAINFQEDWRWFIRGHSKKHCEIAAAKLKLISEADRGKVVIPNSRYRRLEREGTAA